MKRMKTLLLSLLASFSLAATAQAQILRPQTASNVLIGGVAGAIIGEHNNHHAAEGALIGATAGYLWSAATTPPSQPSYAPTVTEYRSSAPVVVERPCGHTAPTTVIVERPVVVYRDAPQRVIYVTPAPVYWGPYYQGDRGHGHGRHHRWR